MKPANQLSRYTISIGNFFCFDNFSEMPTNAELHGETFVDEDIIIFIFLDLETYD